MTESEELERTKRQIDERYKDLDPEDWQNWKFEGRKLIKQYQAKKKAQQNKRKHKQLTLDIR